MVGVIEMSDLMQLGRGSAFLSRMSCADWLVDV